MTPDDLDRLERLHHAATQGPWHTNTALPAAVFTGTGSGNDPAVARTVDRRDAVLIAAMREALPELLRAARERDQLRAKLDRANQPDPCDLKTGPPYDFGWCNTHDTTFPIGSTCEWDGVTSITAHLQDKIDEQRSLKVHAEMECDRLHAATERVTDALADIAQTIEWETCVHGPTHAARIREAIAKAAQ